MVGQIAPPLKTLACSVGLAVFGAFQAGEVAVDLPGPTGDVVSLIVSTLSAVGAFAFARRWWERRQDRLEQAEDRRDAEIAQLRYEVRALTGYANRAYQAALGCGVEIEPPPASLPPSP